MTGKHLKIGIALAAAAALLIALRTLPLGGALGDLVDYVRGAGLVGALLYGLIYVLASVALLPASLLTLGAGFVWGPLLGTALVSPASVMGATAAFLVGRFLARDAVRRKVEGHATFAAIDRAIGQGGLKVVTLLRLSPVVPFNLLNYGLALTAVRTRDFVLGSFIGMLPATFLYVYLGSLAGSIGELLSGRTAPAPGRTALFWGGLVATATVTALLTRLARRELARAVPTPAPTETAS